MFDTFALIDTTGEVFYCKDFSSGSPVDSKDINRYVQLVSNVGILSNSLSSSSSFQTEEGVRDQEFIPLQISNGKSAYVMYNIDNFVFILTCLSDGENLAAASVCLRSICRLFCLLVSKRQLSGKCSKPELMHALLTLESFLLTTQNSAYLPALSEGVERASVDHASDAALQRVLGSLFEMSKLKGASIFCTHSCLASRSPAVVDFVARARLLSHPFASNQRATQLSIYVNDIPDLLTIVRLFGSCFLTLYTSAENVILTDLLLLTRSIASVLLEAGISIPRQIPPLQKQQLTTDSRVLDIAYFRKGVFVKPTLGTQDHQHLLGKLVAMTYLQIQQDQTEDFNTTNKITILQGKGHVFCMTSWNNENIAILCNNSTQTSEIERILLDIKANNSELFLSLK